MSCSWDEFKKICFEGKKVRNLFEKQYELIKKEIQSMRRGTKD